MSDNGKMRRGRAELFGSASGVGLVGVITWIGTKYQVKPHEGYAQGPLHVRDKDDAGVSEQAPPTPRLAVPPKWTHRNDLPCVTRLPVGNQKDPYDTSDRLVARALCAGCPVKRECLDAAQVEEEGLGPRSRYLVRGGLTPTGRAEKAGIMVEPQPIGLVQ